MGTEGEPERNGDGAAYIFEGTMNEMEIVEISLLTEDSQNSYAIPTGSGNGWYTPILGLQIT